MALSVWEKRKSSWPDGVDASVGCGTCPAVFAQTEVWMLEALTRCSIAILCCPYCGDRNLQVIPDPPYPEDEIPF